MEDRWLSVDEIGEYLGVKRDTIYRWISEKNMPAHKIERWPPCSDRKQRFLSLSFSSLGCLY